MFSSVVLPDPFGPIRPTISPGAMVSDTLSTAVSPPKRMVMPSAVRVALSVTAKDRVPTAFTFCAGNRRSSHSFRPEMPSALRNIAIRIISAMPICVVPKTCGTATPKMSKPLSKRRNTSVTMVIVTAPATAPVTVVMPPTISIASSWNVSTKKNFFGLKAPRKCAISAPDRAMSVALSTQAISRSRRMFTPIAPAAMAFSRLARNLRPETESR